VPPRCPFDLSDIIHGDCLDVMDTMQDDCIDSSATDPPYHHPGGFMSQAWDRGSIAFQPNTWRKLHRVLKPGAHAVVFGSSRTFHRLWCALEDAGFELRDTLLWIHGEGLPKSRNLDGDWQGWGSSLKPAYEPIALVRKPLQGTLQANAEQHGTGALHVDACRVAFSSPADEAEAKGKNRHGDFDSGLRHNQVFGQDIPRGQYGNYDPTGRWPTNILLDGSPEVTELFPHPHPAGTQREAWIPDNPTSHAMYGKAPPNYRQGRRVGDAGSAARFFPHLPYTEPDTRFLYCPKASTRERQGSQHKTIKPLKLMRWLVRLITPPGGTVFDPFAGTGTTGQAALEQGFGAFLVEQDPRYIADIHRRLAPFLHSSTLTAI